MAINWDNAIWLAKRQIRDTWTGYIYTAIYFSVMGAALAFGQDATREIAHPILMLIILQPVVTGRYMSLKADNGVRSFQEFLRTMPLGFSTIVSARAIAMLVAGVLNLPLYFVWFWWADSWPGVGEFISWCLFWIGIAIAAAGWSLYLEYRFSLRDWSLLNAGIMVGVVLLALITVGLVFPSFRPIAWSITTVQSHPWLTIGASWLSGVAGLLAGMNFAVIAFRRREYVL